LIEQSGSSPVAGSSVLVDAVLGGFLVMAGLRERAVAASVAVLVTATTVLSGAAVGSGGRAWAGLARATAWAADAGIAAAAQRSPARPGSNLLLNPGAEAGAASARGWDSVTIPGWQIAGGLPTVVRYGTPGFPRATGRWPLARGGRLFAGGPGGTARLRQLVRLRPAGDQPAAAPMRYALSAWLGGTGRSRASVRVAFVSAAGRVLARRTIGPVGTVAGGHGLADRAAAGVVPKQAVGARVSLVLATSLTNFDGPHSPYRGYDRAVADGLRFSVSAAVGPAPRLVPPAVRVPRYQHVFLFYFENQDFRSVIGNTRQAPYLNGLLPRGSLLADSFAEEHPSDGNYLAMAGGSTFGVPPTNPLEANPRYTIAARNIGDLLDASHRSWKEYLQSANGPCDDTVHGYYWNDDLPMTYFADVRDRPAYCSAHLVPLEALPADLATAAGTPSFAWLGADDCSDMEGCGIRAGDRFLAAELGAVMRSPAWRTQRSLAIITFDEDAYDHERPAQRVPTLILGSAGVRHGYVSHVRYTHYSLLRTIEAALGVGTLTRNDRYAQPANDVFSRGRAPGGPAWPPAPAQVRAPGPVTSPPGRPGPVDRRPVPGTGPLPAYAHHPTAFVVNYGSGTVTPVDLASKRAGPPIKVGNGPRAIAITPGGRTAYVANSGSGTVTPISTVTGRAGRPIRVGRDPRAIAITPGGRTAYVANSGSGTVTPISTVTGRAGRPIRVGRDPRAIAITPGGRTAYVLDWGSAAVTPIDIATGRAESSIPVGSYPSAIAIGGRGTTAYVACYGSDTVTPITIATGRPGRAIPVGQAPDAIAAAPGGKTVYAVGGDSDTLTPITTGTGRAGPAIPVGYSPAAITVPRRGTTAYVVNTISGSVTPVSTLTGRAGTPIPVGIYAYPLAMALTPSGDTAAVVGTYAGRVILVNTRTRRVTAKITVGRYPLTAAIAR
jgi:YVTN family beta-propeller protein